MTTDDADKADLAALKTMTAGLAEASMEIGEDHWLLQTPCEAWNLRDLVDHVIGGNWYTIRILAGETSEDALTATMARFGGEAISPAAAAESAFEQLESFENEGVLDRSWPHVAGELPGRQVLRLRLHDLIVHTWDINETFRQPASIPKPLAEWGLAELQQPTSLMAKHFAVQQPPDRKPASDDQALRYLHALGR